MYGFESYRGKLRVFNSQLDANVTRTTLTGTSFTSPFATVFAAGAISKASLLKYMKAFIMASTRKPVLIDKGSLNSLNRASEDGIDLKLVKHILVI